MLQGCYTALITPFTPDGEVDYETLHRLVEFQVIQGVSGILAVGTTGESATLDWDEHSRVIGRIAEYAGDRCQVIAGTGSNNVAETLEYTREVEDCGIDAILLVEPYYNGPSSIEIRREYMGPVAEEFPELEVIPYVIPGRSGTQLLPEDLALLHRDHENINTVKEASGSLDNVRRTREVCGDSLSILSGNDGQTCDMLTDPGINGDGAVSVMSNIMPAGVQGMVDTGAGGEAAESRNMNDAMNPLFGCVSVKTQEPSPYGERLCKSRNPVPVKTLMRILGMHSGRVRPPLGRMPRSGLTSLLDAAREVWDKNPDLLRPIGDFFDVDVEERLHNPPHMDELVYEDEEQS